MKRQDRMDNRDMKNTMKRSIDPESPIWILIFINIIFIIIAVSIYLYNLPPETLSGGSAKMLLSNR